MQLAADAYLVVMQQPSGSFTELATRNYASIKYALEQYDEAVDAYMSLSDIAVIDNNRQEAQRGLMWSFYKNKQYRNALAQAQKVIISRHIIPKIKTRIPNSLKPQLIHQLVYFMLMLEHTSSTVAMIRI